MLTIQAYYEKDKRGLHDLTEPGMPSESRLNCLYAWPVGHRNPQTSPRC